HGWCEQPDRESNPADGPEKAHPAPKAARHHGDVGRAALEEAIPRFRSEQSLAYLGQAGRRHRLPDRRQLTADPEHRRRARLQMEVARAEVPALLNPVLE